MNEELPEDRKPIRRFSDFYAFYLDAHSDSRSRRMHFAGTSLALLCFFLTLGSGNPGWVVGGLLCGYGFAWTAHFIYDKNEPQSFRQPFFSFIAEWRMWFEIVMGRIPF